MKAILKSEGQTFVATVGGIRAADSTKLGTSSGHTILRAMGRQSAAILELQQSHRRNYPHESFVKNGIFPFRGLKRD